MSVIHSPKTVKDGLLFAVDAADRNSYLTASTTWTNIGSGIRDYDLLLQGTVPTYTASAFNGALTTNITRTSPYSQSYFTFTSPDSTLLNLPYGDHTIECFINPKTFTYGTTVTSSLTSEGFAGILIWEGGAHTGLFLQSTTTLLYGISDSSASFFSTTAPLANYTNLPVHIVATRSASVMTIYVNGTQANSTTTGVITPVIYSRINIGTAKQAVPTPNGSVYASNIDYYGVRLYNRPLNAVEVWQNYTTMRYRFGI